MMPVNNFRLLSVQPRIAKYKDLGLRIDPDPYSVSHQSYTVPLFINNLIEKLGSSGITWLNVR